MSRHQCDQTERNFVAEAFNWEQRCKGENEAARAWDNNWGQLFAPNMPRSYKDKIAQLEKQISKLPVQAMMSNSQLSYTEVVPYQEFGSKDYKRKSSALSDDS